MTHELLCVASGLGGVVAGVLLVAIVQVSLTRRRERMWQRRYDRESMAYRVTEKRKWQPSGNPSTSSTKTPSTN